MKMSGLTKERGKFFYAVIKGKNVIGRIQVESGCIYLCQNKVRGLECKDKLGYKYSWIVYSLKPHIKGFRLIDKELKTYPYFFLLITAILLIGLNSYLTDLGKVVMLSLFIFSSYQFLSKTKFGQLLINSLNNIWS